MTYFHADALGSVQKHTSAAGAVVQTIEYDAWGNALSGTPGAYGFTSREPDLETGLQYYRARYYDARAGRFLSEDPIGLRGGINRLAYVSGRPTFFRDVTGTEAMNEWEYLWCLWHPLACRAGWECMVMAESFDKARRGGKPGDNDGTNAEKHCLVSCCLQRTVPGHARTVGDNHEARQQNSSPCSSNMDKANNNMGRVFGAANPNMDCGEICRKAPLVCKPQPSPCQPLP